MKKLKRYWWIGLVLIAIAMSILPAYSRFDPLRPSGFQVSTLGALNKGVYDGAASLSELKQHGNFGLGTFEGLDGEMVLLNGKVYQIKTNGKTHIIADNIKTPFAAVTFFRRERSLHLTGKITYQELQQAIDQQLPSQNLPYAIRIQGLFPDLQVRSVPKQIPPYPPLNDVVKKQTIFELRNVRGTLVGFRLPPYFKSVNAAGYHFHFITSDRNAGGHLLAGEFLNPVADVETLYNWQMKLPSHPTFAQAPLE